MTDRSRDEKQEPGPKLVRIRVFSGPTAPLQADLARNILREQGIFCSLAGEHSAEALPGVDVVQLLVLAADAENASEILAGFLEHPPAECGVNQEI